MRFCYIKKKHFKIGTIGSSHQNAKKHRLDFTLKKKNCALYV